MPACHTSESRETCEGRERIVFDLAAQGEAHLTLRLAQALM